MRKTLSLTTLLILTISSFFLTLSDSQQEKTILVVSIDGSITHATLELIEETLNHANAINALAVVIQINTPGGGLEETTKIIDLIENSQIPVIGYVYPKGGKAWSAGTFILMGCHIAVMANYSVIGSCQPVELTPTGFRLINDTKHINALKEWMRNLAEMNGRNASVAERFITENLNLNATKALEYGVIEFVAPDIKSLIKAINGTEVNGKIILTNDVKIVYHSPSLKYHILSVLTDPSIASLLLMLGIFSLLFGISSPGYGAEVFGAIAILLALFGMGFSLPYVSIILILVGFILLALEIFVIPGFGVVGIGGIICLILGSVFLVPGYFSTNWLITSEYQSVLLVMAVVPSILIAAFFLFALYKVLQIKNKKPSIGVIEGEEAETLDKITPTKPGYIKYRGEYWMARSKEGVIPERKKVIIEKKEGHILVVSIKKEGKD